MRAMVSRTFDLQNDHGRLVEYRADGVTTTRTYLYNGAGERVGKRNPSASTSDIYFVYDQQGQLLGEYLTDGTPSREHVWVDNTPVAVLSTYGTSTTDEVHYLLTDHLNTPRQAVRASTNTTIWRWDLTMSAFGDHVQNSDPDADGVAWIVRLRYPGQYFDSESGLHYNYLRDYDPGTGRYIQSDPIGLLGGVATYGYVLNSPLRNSDPLGLYCRSMNGYTTCVNPDGPRFTVKTPAGFPSYVGPDDYFDHEYHVTRDLGCADATAAMLELVNSPTPTIDGQHPSSASFAGTRNNAAVPYVARNNLVTSYLTTDLNTNKPLVVNMSGVGSAFGPGYVARGVSNGKMHTYGEGNEWRQADFPFAAWNFIANEVVWGGQMSEMIGRAGGACGCD